MIGHWFAEARAQARSVLELLDEVLREKVGREGERQALVTLAKDGVPFDVALDLVEHAREAGRRMGEIDTPDEDDDPIETEQVSE